MISVPMEYVNYNSSIEGERTMLLTIDFDNCICTEDAYPEVGRPVPYAAESIKLLGVDHTLILWTCRCGAAADKAVKYLEDTFLWDYFDGINCWPQYVLDEYEHESRKVVGKWNIDDRNAGCPLIIFEDNRVVDWLRVMDFLRLEEDICC